MSAPTAAQWEAKREAIARRHGLAKLHAPYRQQDRHVSIDNITVPDSERGQGHGARAMTDIIAWADDHGITLTLTPSSDFGASKSRLEKWYRSLGFKPNAGRSKDFRFRETMIREPKAAATQCRKPSKIIGGRVCR